MPTKSDRVVVGARDASREVRQRFNEQAASLERAQNLLAPNEVAGEYDAGRLLATTLGGQLRAITVDDLRTFKRNAEALGKRYSGGITAKGVIDLSAPADRERSNREIRVAVPTQRWGNNVHFQTNAGPHSNVTRHHVDVQFLNLDAAVASPSLPAELVRTVAAGKIKIQCDCDHWRYRLAYIATIGGYNAGTAQPNFPKITNPHLIGVACKHVLRVAQQLSSPMVRQYIEKLIASRRVEVKPKLVATSKKDAQAMADLQRKQAGQLRNTVESITEKRLRLAQQRRVREIADRQKLKVPKNAAQLAQAKRKLELDVRRLASLGGITQKQLGEILAKLKGN